MDDQDQIVSPPRNPEEAAKASGFGDNNAKGSPAYLTRGTFDFWRSEAGRLALRILTHDGTEGLVYFATADEEAALAAFVKPAKPKAEPEYIGRFNLDAYADEMRKTLEKAGVPVMTDDDKAAARAVKIVDYANPEKVAASRAMRAEIEARPREITDHEINVRRYREAHGLDR